MEYTVSSKANSAEFSAWSPLRYPIFRMLWLTSVVSNIGSCMHDVGAAWLMTSLTTNPLLVALVQTASALSIFLLALPAGALADIMDRRRYLILLQTMMMLIAATLAVATYFHAMNPPLLLALTFCLGTAAALNAPAWQATVPELVPTDALSHAIVLNSVGMNVSRAIGPAIAGLIITAIGTVAVFAINALSFLAIIIAFLFWQREPQKSTLPAERFMSAIRTGVRYVYASPAFHNVLIRTAVFMLFASVIWALLPLIARVGLAQGAAGYGILFGLFGTGAVIAALIAPRLNEKLNSDQRIYRGFLLYAFAALILALIHNFYVACGAMLISGFAWMTTSSTLMLAAQQAVPSWIRGRAISIYFMVMFGGMALGSTIWGILATHFTISVALLVAALGLIMGAFLTRIYTFVKIQSIDHTPYSAMRAPQLKEELHYQQGPIMVTVEYTVNHEQINDFTKTMRKLRRIRLREGAFFWKLFKDMEDPNRFIECFMSETWVEHLRLHEHVSMADYKIQKLANTFHTGNKGPHVTHLVACDISKH